MGLRVFTRQMLMFGAIQHAEDRCLSSLEILNGYRPVEFPEKLPKRPDHVCSTEPYPGYPMARGSSSYLETPCKCPGCIMFLSSSSEMMNSIRNSICTVGICSGMRKPKG